MSMILHFEANGSGGYVVCDARNRRHSAANEAELWQLLRRLSSDKDLPAAKISESNDFIGLAAGIIRRALPKHADLVDIAEPAMHGMAALGPIVQRIRGER